MTAYDDKSTEKTMNDEKFETVHVNKVNRREDPSEIGTTLIKYTAYVAITLMILYFTANYLIPIVYEVIG